MKKRPARRRRLAALAAERDRALQEMIRRWQRLPPDQRTQFLRRRVGWRMTAL